MPIILRIFILSVFCVSYPFILAANDIKSNPKSIVMVQELSNIDDALFISYCPIDATQTFNTHCSNEDAYKFYGAVDSENTDVFKVSGKTYFAQWNEVVHTGRFAFTYGSNADATIAYRPKVDTFIGDFGPGAILIRPYTSPLDAALGLKQRVKNAMVQKYGDIAKKMNYQVLEHTKVACVKNRTSKFVTKDCTIK